MKTIEYIYNYEEQIYTDYVKTKDQSGLVYVNEKEKAKIMDGIKWLLKNIGESILHGQSIMNTSLPVFVFDPRSMHEVFCYELRGAPYYLTKAFYSPDEYERIKWVTVFLVSQLYITTLQLKPFNPIIGETFQCKVGNLNLYSEHTSNHPNIAHFYGFDDEKLYKIYGYLEVTATTGPNSVTAMKKGKYTIEFKDGDKYQIHIPFLEIRGTTINPRIFAYLQKGLVINEEKDLGCLIEFNPDKVGYFKSWFSAKQDSYPDSFVGVITKASNIKISAKDCNHSIIKEKEDEYATVSGEWAKEVIFDGEDKYWDIKEYPLLPIYKIGYQLPSDGRNRLDLQNLIKGDLETSQKEKEKMEVQQRVDRKLRAQYKK
ncbi:MAG: oxysterol-binding protein [archaeon]|nr:oxysterol-binding protein [archaeon]